MFANEPAAQGLQLTDPVTEKRPNAHSTHVAFDVAPYADESVPLGQGMHA